MIRRDYFLRIIERIGAALLLSRQQIDAGETGEAATTLDQAFLDLIGTGPEVVSQLSETELLAKISIDEPTHVVREKIQLLVGLLQEAGRIRMADGREAAGAACWVKALDILLMLQLEDIDLEFPEFVPNIDLLRGQLRDTTLPPRTLAALWRVYERLGVYGSAEDALFALLEVEPDSEALQAEAEAFYARLMRQDDEALEAGGLPRTEIMTSLAELRAPKV